MSFMNRVGHNNMTRPNARCHATALIFMLNTAEAKIYPAHKC